MKTRFFVLVITVFWLLARSSAQTYYDVLPTDLISPHGKSDVVFLLDASDSSPNEKNFELMKWYVRYLLSQVEVGGDKVRVAVTPYANFPMTEFDLNKYSTETDVNNAIDDVSFVRGPRNTYSALHEMRTRMFTPANGDRKNVKNICIIITDGLSNREKEKTIPEAEAAKAASIHIYAIGIGLTDRSELDAIASPPEVGGKKNSYNVKSFDVLQDLKDYSPTTTTVTVPTTTVTTTAAVMTTARRSTKVTKTTKPESNMSTKVTTTTKPYECQDGHFGMDCTKTCRCSNKSEVCDKFTGRCVSGCLVGWKASDCQWRDCSHVAYCGIHTCLELRDDYSCSCLDGYENSDPHNCEDIYECEQGDICDIHRCRNTEGSYDCICRGGYVNIHHTFCALKFANSLTSEQDFLLADITVGVIIQILSATVIAIFAVTALLCGRTVGTSIRRFSTTEASTRNLHFRKRGSTLIAIYELSHGSEDISIAETDCALEESVPQAVVIEESVPQADVIEESVPQEDAIEESISQTEVTKESVHDISDAGENGHRMSRISHMSNLLHL